MLQFSLRKWFCINVDGELDVHNKIEMGEKQNRWKFYETTEENLKKLVLSKFYEFSILL